MKKTIGIKGMSCAHCVKAVEKALSGLEGVTTVKVSLEEKCAVIETATPLPDSILKETIKEAGFKVTDIK